jgi:pimeloyl-ACP methyl ester carboxylesterase/DNA-binding CsgD family transcriptional regulator
MEPPPVQYVRTADGYDIAYWTVGHGLPFVYIPGQFSDLNVFWRETAMHGPWMQGLAERFRLTAFDGRGQGMSTRGIREAQTIDTLGYDLEAVAERTQSGSFVLLGRWYGCHIAVRYALAHPERVSALILVGCAEENSAWPSSVYQQLPEQNWDVFLLSQMARTTWEKSKQTIDRQNRASTREDLALRAQAYRASSVTADLSRIKVPTLVLHPRDYILLPAEESRRVAAKIPGARFAYIEGEMLPGDPATGLRAIEEFLKQELAPGERQSQPSVTLEDGYRASVAGLSRRQMQVLRLVAQGKTNREIAEELVLSERTVQRHIADLYLKIDVRNRSEATSFALNRLE